MVDMRRSRARDDDDVARDDVASMATTGIAIGARCARACVDARERCLARDGISWRMFLFHSRVRRAVVRCRVVVVVVRSARLMMRDPRLAGRSLARAW